MWILHFVINSCSYFSYQLCGIVSWYYFSACLQTNTRVHPCRARTMPAAGTMRIATHVTVWTATSAGSARVCVLTFHCAVWLTCSALYLTQIYYLLYLGNTPPSALVDFEFCSYMHLWCTQKNKINIVLGGLGDKGTVILVTVEVYTYFWSKLQLIISWKKQNNYMQNMF
jgi:hypothetical protein